MAGRLVKGQIGVIGGAECLPEIYEIACDVGREIAKNGFALVCGGLTGVMEAACRGAQEAGGITIGILPTSYKGDANPYCNLVIPTGLGHARNILVVHAADALVAVAGEVGTLSEIAIALKTGKPIVGIKSWGLEGRVQQVERGEEAVAKLMEMLG
jgi:uncharacterized protein (TIGR00725 family)